MRIKLDKVCQAPTNMPVLSSQHGIVSKVTEFLSEAMLLHKPGTKQVGAQEAYPQNFSRTEN